MAANPARKNFFRPKPGEFIAKSADFQVISRRSEHHDPIWSVTRTLLGHDLD